MGYGDDGGVVGEIVVVVVMRWMWMGGYECLRVWVDGEGAGVVCGGGFVGEKGCLCGGGEQRESDSKYLRGIESHVVTHFMM